MPIRHNVTNRDEIREIVIADAVLIIAFSLTIAGGIGTLFSSPSKFASTFAYFVPIAALGVSLSFILHELMHKFAAQRYGAIAGFRTSHNGLVLTLLTGAFGFLLGVPGATMIYASGFTRRQNGIVSLAGPLTNFAVFLVFFAISLIVPQGGYLAAAVSFTIFISILLAFFNMLPIPPLDGSKVLAWNKWIYLATIGVVFVLMMLFTQIPISSIVFMLLIALFFSFFYRFAL